MNIGTNPRFRTGKCRISQHNFDGSLPKVIHGINRETLLAEEDLQTYKRSLVSFRNIIASGPRINCGKNATLNLKNSP